MLNKVRYRISIFLAFSYGRAEERMLDEMECHSQRTKTVRDLRHFLAVPLA